MRKSGKKSKQEEKVEISRVRLQNVLEWKDPNHIDDEPAFEYVFFGDFAEFPHWLIGVSIDVLLDEVKYEIKIEGGLDYLVEDGG